MFDNLDPYAHMLKPDGKSPAQVQEEAIDQLAAQLPVKTPRINLAEFFPSGRIETMHDMYVIRDSFHKLDKSHPQYQEMRSLLLNGVRPQEPLARELFNMDSANLIFDDEAGTAQLIGREPWMKERH